MATQLPFKQYARGTRLQATDLIYNGGMQYSLKPIASGFNRRLINYDLIDSGGALKSRPGLKKSDNVFLEQAPAGGNLILQKGSGNALFAWYSDFYWRANSVAALGDTLEPDIYLGGGGMATGLDPGHLYLIGNPMQDVPPGGYITSAIPCFKLGTLINTSPFYSKIAQTKGATEQTNPNPSKNVFWMNEGILQYDVIPAAPPTLQITVDKENQECILNGTANHDMWLRLGYASVYPEPAQNLVSRVHVSGVYPASLKATPGEYGGYFPQIDVNTDFVTTLRNQLGMTLDIPSGGVFVNAHVKVQTERGTVSTSWVHYDGHSVSAPAEYEPINNVPFSENYWMQYSPCCYGFDGKFVYLSSRIEENDLGYLQSKAYLMVSNGGRGTRDNEIWQFEQDKAPVKTLNPSEASMWGYNMLLDNPYTFANGATGTVITLTGILPYNAGGTQIELNPRINQTVMLECFYSSSTPANYKMKFEWKDVASASWTEIATVDPNAQNKFRCKFTNPGREIYIRATALKGVAEEAVIASGFNFSPTAKIDKFENYDLTTCRDMMYANRRLCLYGLPQDESLIFFSDYNDPGYFPYPHNMLQFDAPVKKVIEYQQNWLVFTTNSIYSVILQADGLTWESAVLQTGLEITDINALFITAVKSFVTFKSGNYIYLVVPSSSVAGTLTIAPVYLPIKELLDDLDGFFKETLFDVHGYTGTYSLKRFQTYTTLDELHFVFSGTLTDGEWANIDLIYDTLSRTWRVYSFMTAAMFLPFVEDITQGVQLLTNPPEHSTEICSYQFQTSAPDTTDDTTTKYKNIQLLDTGNRDITVELKKRFREYQYTVYMQNPGVLRFSTQFYIDDILRKQSTEMQGELQPDPEQEGRYLLTITADPVYDLVPNVLAPENVLIPEGYWQLDVSDFTTLQSLKIRQDVSGKGYAPRLVIKADNTASHELLHNAWVYRTLNSR